MIRKLKTSASAPLIESGIWMTPLKRSTGELMWMRFSDSPSSHVLIVFQPGRENHVEFLLGGVSFCSGVERVDLGCGDSPLSMRRAIRRYANAVRSGSTHGRTVIIIHRLSDVFAHVNRADTMESLRADMNTIIRSGPSNGIHLIIAQDTSDYGLGVLNSIDCDVDVTLAVGRLTPVACELALGGPVSTACVRGRTGNLCWGQVRSNGHHASGLIDIRESIVGNE